MYVRKFLGFVITTLFTVVFLDFISMLTNSIDRPFAAFGLLLTGTVPFILIVGVPVSFLSDYLTKNFSNKQRYSMAIFIHIIFGLLIGLFISYFFESMFLVVVTVVAAFIFWLIDEILRKVFAG